MVQWLNFLGACCALVALVQCQSSRKTQVNALEDMIEYARLFEHQHAPKEDTLDDSELRGLFNEFLLQRREKTQQKPFTTTTTTTQAPVPSLPVFKLQQKSINAQPAQKRPSATRIRINNPETIRNNFASVPSSFSHITEPTSTVGRPLRRKQTTTTTPIIFKQPNEELFKIGQEQPQIIQRTHHRTAPEIAFTPAPVSSEESRVDEIEFRRQAESAKYQFASAVDDGISGNLLQREEVRDGLAVRGKYSYSDGFFKRTVHYEADERGYRVVKEEVEALDGPHTNPNGHAKVSSYVDGNSVNYEITKDDIRKKDEKLKFALV